MFLFEKKSFRITAAGVEPDALELIETCNGAFRSFRIVNRGDKPCRIREAVVLSLPHTFPADTRIYGEGFNMLSQYWGTLEEIESTAYTDRDHYRLPVCKGFFTCYNLLHLFPSAGSPVLGGFSSCRRFTNEIRFNRERIEFAVDCEGTEIPAHGFLELEEVYLSRTGGREEQLAEFAARLAANHPPLPYSEPVTGWCSWYCYGPEVTESDILRSAGLMKAKFPELRFIQIDDGYQAHMGDWLIPHPNFPSGVAPLCRRIGELGLEPAIWVAPFIAEENSELFRKHPDWFVMDETGVPLRSDRCSFGGWRCAPWYMLDASVPAACDYLRTVFRTMRREWNCRYFKLDATVWGCLPFGVRHDPSLTRVEAFRRGMEALTEGAGAGSLILGCNAPMWPSLGTCSAMRVTGDISRTWKHFKALARECFSRNWQNGKLWINDPDCLVLENLSKTVVGPGGELVDVPQSSLSGNEFSFHRAHILASGGMLLSSDIPEQVSAESAAVIRKLVSMYGRTAAFSDPAFRHGTIPHPEGSLHCYFNWSDSGRMYALPPPGAREDFWTGGAVRGDILTLPPRSARVILVRG